MFGGNMGLHVIDNPAGTHGYVGSIPVDLLKLRKPTRSDVMGGRIVEIDGERFGWGTSKLFPTRKEAIDYAEAKGYEVVKKEGDE